MEILSGKDFKWWLTVSIRDLVEEERKGDSEIEPPAWSFL